MFVYLALPVKKKHRYSGVKTILNLAEIRRVLSAAISLEDLTDVQQSRTETNN